MAILTPQQGADKLRVRISQSGQAYEQGINAVTVNPAELAIANKQKWANSMMDAINNDRFAKGLQGVTLTKWKSAAITYGVPRYTQGATKAGENYLAFAQKFYPYLAQVQATVNAMPSLTFEERLERMIANARALHDFRNL